MNFPPLSEQSSHSGMERNIPSVLVDVITQDIIEDPVTAEDGHVYSRHSITDWIETCQLAEIPIISPTTRQEMGCKLVDNVEIKQLLTTMSNLLMEYKWDTSSKRSSNSRDLCSASPISNETNEDTSLKQDVIHNKSINTPLSTIGSNILHTSRVNNDDNLVMSNPTTLMSLPISLKNMGDIFRLLDFGPPFCTELLPAWTPPCLTVIGNESSGKSTILERLLMMSIFPRGEDICTRVPIKVQLRYSPVARTPVLTVVDSTTGVVLSKAVPLPSLDSAHMDIMTEMTAIIRDQCGNDVGVCLDKTIVVNIQSPHLPTLDIVDLPGIVAACSREEIAADVPAKTKHLVEEYIKSHPEAMYLAFLEAGSRFSCAACMEMVQKFNIQSKTIGVVTKCDLISVKAMKELRRCVAMQDISVGGIVLEPFGYVCTMHDDIDGGDSLKSAAGGDCTSVQQIFCQDSTNYSRLIKQDVCETNWFASVDYQDMLSSGHAGTRAIISKIKTMFMQSVKTELVPKVLLFIHKQREALADRHSELGLPLPPSVHPTTKNEKDVNQFKCAFIDHMRDIILSHRQEMKKLYAAGILQPLLSSVLATSTGKIEFVDCLNPANSVEMWLHSLQKKIEGMCTKSVGNAITFWCEYVVSMMQGDVSSFRVWRFDNARTLINQALRDELTTSFVPLRDVMEKSIYDFISTVNQHQGVSVRYNFSEHEKVTLCWESEALGHSLVYHLTRSEGMMTSDRLIQIASSVIESLQSDQLTESCGSERSLLIDLVHSLEFHYRKIVSSLLSSADSSFRDADGEQTAGDYCWQLKSTGLSAQDLLRHKFSIDHLRQGSFTAGDMINAGVAPTKLYKAGYSVKDLRVCNINLSVIIGQAVLEKKTLTEMVVSGFSFRELEDFGFDFVMLLGHSCTQKARGYCLKALLLLDLTDEEITELKKRGLMSALVRFYDEVLPQVDGHDDEIDDVMRQINASKEEEEDTEAIGQTKEAILSVFCKVYDDNSSGLTVVRSSNTAMSDGMSGGGPADVLLRCVSDIISLIASSDRDVAATSVFVAIQSLRLITSNSVEATDMAVQSHLLDASWLLGLMSKVLNHLRLEVLMLVRNIGVYHVDAVADTQFVSICLDCLRTERNDTTKIMAAFILFMLTSTDNGYQQIVDQNGRIEELIALLPEVMLLSVTATDDALVVVLQGIVKISIQAKTWTASNSVVMVDYLCKALSGIKMSHKQHIVNIIHTLCLTSQVHKKSFVEKGTVIKDLVELLGVSHDESNEKAIKLLLLFIEDNSEIKLEIAQEGGIASLLLMLRDDCSLSSKIASTSLLIPLAAEPSNSLDIVKHGVVDMLLDMLHEESDVCKEAAAATMRCLSYVEDNRLVIANEGAIGPLVGILGDTATSASCKIMAARTLRNLAFNCPDNKLAIANQGGVEELVAMLQPDHITEENGKVIAAGVLQNLAYKSPEIVTMIIEANALTWLREMIMNGSLAGKEAAAGTVRNLSSDDDNCLLVYCAGVLEALLEMLRLDSSVSPCATAAREALRTIAKNETCREHIKKSGIQRKDINYKSKNW